MAPPKKKVKTVLSEEKVIDSESEPELHDDYRTSWLLASENMFVEITAKGETFRVHRSVVCRHSEYFRTCLSKPFQEAADGTVVFDDIEPRYLAFYLGVAYTYSSIIPHACPPAPAPHSPFHPAALVSAAPSATLRDFIEVYKLGDRFLSPPIGEFMLQCINAKIGEGHRALYHSSWAGAGAAVHGESGVDKDQDKAKGADKGKGDRAARERERARQRRLMREFADAYEALEMAHGTQEMLAGRIIEYFCEGVDYRMWDAGMEELLDRSRFVGMVSKGFARKLADASCKRAKLKRKQLAPP
ncbi:hypothetical protein ESCO_001978 [Escovopsis weberi]|uniref:BTB domain-containing protein n=1 Tax=Escovopsis weberi TaxID=150374 RepID=A0A0M8N949_ESCWE|nr:hypothetical protein ESCO_001978 [Escovopsis weberi]